MRRARLFVVSLAVVLLTAGCAVTVGGTAQRAPGFTPRPLTGQTIQQVLLGQSTLSRIVKQPLAVDLRFPPRVGGPEALQADGPAAPVDCLGVAGTLEQIAYRSSHVRGVAAETWRHAARSTAVTDVKEGVVSLPTAADADALFSQFSQRWQTCDGRTQAAWSRSRSISSMQPT